MNSFKLEIYATDGCFYNGDCEHLIFGSADGSRGVMAGHEPMICALAKGEIRYVTDGEWEQSRRHRGLCRGHADICAAVRGHRRQGGGGRRIPRQIRKCARR